MRPFRALVAAALAAVLSGASPVLAESAGWVSGHVLDAGGRPLAGLRVDLFGARQGQPVGVPMQASRTDGRGAWSFSSVPAGEYVVRTVYRDRTAGVPVSVAEASEVTGVVIVAPSLPPPERFSQAQGAAAAVGAINVPLLVAGSLVAALSTAMVVVVARDES